MLTGDPLQDYNPPPEYICKECGGEIEGLQSLFSEYCLTCEEEKERIEHMFRAW